MREPRTVLVTGASSGIGLEAARALAASGALVVLACRDAARGQAACAQVAAAGGRAELLELDLACLAGVRCAADEFKKRHGRLDALVNNAGIWTRERRTTADGLELIFGTNHVGHFLLTRLLQDRLEATRPSRIVNVSSEAHKSGRLDFDDLQLERRWSGWQAYANSKLANVLFTRELARRLPPGVTANAVHPGVISTRIFRDLPGWLKALFGLVFASPEKGARPLVRLCDGPDVADVSGRYFDKLEERPGSAASQDAAAAARLWKASEQLAGLS